jgi:hypothetical protein
VKNTFLLVTQSAGAAPEPVTTGEEKRKGYPSLGLEPRTFRSVAWALSNASSSELLIRVKEIEDAIVKCNTLL